MQFTFGRSAALLRSCSLRASSCTRRSGGSVRVQWSPVSVGIELQWDVAGVDHFQYFQSLLFCHGECSQGRVPLGLLDLGFGAPADGAGFCEYVQCVFQWDVHHYFLPVVAAGPPLGDVPFLLRPVRTGLGSDRFWLGLWLGAACGLGTCGGLCVLLFGAAGLEALFGAAAGVGGFRQDEAEFEVTTYRPFLR